jgi:hypothetical protein
MVSSRLGLWSLIFFKALLDVAIDQIPKTKDPRPIFLSTLTRAEPHEKLRDVIRYGPKRCQVIRCLLLLLAVLSLTGCGGGSLFKVKPAPDLPPLANGAKTSVAGGVMLRVAPLLSDEESQDLFEANLPLSGVLPVRVALKYEGDQPLELKRARFHLRDADGREWKLLSPKNAISRILKSNGISLYNPNSRKQFENDFKAYALDVDVPLTSSSPTRQGFLFFQAPGKQAVQSPRGLTLQVDRLPQPISVSLN